MTTFYSWTFGVMPLRTEYHEQKLFLYSVYIIQPCTSLTSTVSLLSNDTWIHRVHETESELMTFWSTTELELVETHCCVKILTKMSDKVSNRSPGQSFDLNYQQMKEMIQNINFYYMYNKELDTYCVLRGALHNWCKCNHLSVRRDFRVEFSFCTLVKSIHY